MPVETKLESELYSDPPRTCVAMTTKYTTARHSVASTSTVAVEAAVVAAPNCRTGYREGGFALGLALVYCILAMTEPWGSRDNTSLRSPTYTIAAIYLRQETREGSSYSGSTRTSARDLVVGGEPSYTHGLN